MLPNVASFSSFAHGRDHAFEKAAAQQRFQRQFLRPSLQGLGPVFGFLFQLLNLALHLTDRLIALGRF